MLSVDPGALFTCDFTALHHRECFIQVELERDPHTEEEFTLVP